MTLNDEESYELFLILDTYARNLRGESKMVNEWRERFLPVYRAWHQAHPGEIHPTALRGRLSGVRHAD